MASARQAETYLFTIARQPVERALQDLALQSGRELLMTASPLTREMAPALRGRMSVERALHHLLAGTSLTFSEGRRGMILVSARPPEVRRARAPPAVAGEPPDSPSLVVTATLEDPVRLAGDVQLKPAIGDMVDLAHTALGVSAQPAGAGQQSISLRGISAAGDATTAVYFAGVPIAGPTGTSADTGRTTSDLALIDIDRVEVSRTPQGTRHGVGALAGEVDIIPTPARLNVRDAYLSARVTATEGGAPGYLAAGAANMPLAPTLAARLTAYVRYGGGYVDNVRLGVDDVNYERTRGVRASLLYEPSSALRLSGLALYQDRYIADNSAWTRDLDAYRTDRYFLAPTRHEFMLGSLDAQWRPGDVGLRSITSLYRWTLDRNFDRTNTTLFQAEQPEGCLRYFGILQGACSAAQMEAFRGYALHYVPTLLETPIATTRVTQESRIDNGEGRGLRWRIGTFAEKRWERSSSLLSSIDDVAPIDYFGWREITGSRSQLGLFGSLTYRDTDMTRVSLGLRYDRYVIAARNDVLVPNLISGSMLSWPRTTEISNQLSAKFHVDLEVAPGVELHGQMMHSARPAGVNTASVIPEGYLSFKPDYLWGYELGGRLVLAPDVQLTLTGYLNDWRHMQYRALSENRSHAYLVNIGNASVRGVEAELAARLTERLKGRVEASLIDARMLGDDPTRVLVGGASAGDRLPFVSRWRWKAALSYGWTLRNGWDARFSGEWQYQSGYWSTFNRADPDFLATPAYSLVGIGIDLDLGATSLALTGRNLLNSQAPIRALTNAYGPGQTYSYGPRSWMLSWKRQW